MGRLVTNGPRTLAWRWVAGTLVMLLAAVWFSAWIDNKAGAPDWVYLAELGMLWLAGFIAGCIVRRPEAVVLAGLPILVAILFGVQDIPVNSIDPYFYARERVVDIVAPIAIVSAAFIAAGVLAAHLIQFVQRRRSAPSTA